MHKGQSSKSNVISSLIWKLMERGGTQGVQFVISIILARLLLPEDYGVVSLVTIFIALATVFVQSGFNTALIQKKEADETDFSTVFYLSLFIAVLLYVVLFFTAPLIASFYNMPSLVGIVRVLSITLFFGAVNSVQNAYLMRNMLFKKLFFSSIGAAAFSGAFGVALAFLGWGVWALVIQQLMSQLAVMIILWFTVKWRPQLLFSFKRLKSLFSFGSKLLVSSLLNTLYLNIRSLIIGKLYTPAMLGYYNKGLQFPSLISNNVDGSIQSVMLPALSACQDDRQALKGMVRRSIVTSAYLMFPIMAGLAITAKPLVAVLLTEKWLPAVPFMQIFCIMYGLRPIHTANLQAINAMGRSDVFLRLEFIKKIVGMIILAISLPFGIYAMAWGALINTIICSAINAFPNSKLLDYSYKEQIIDILPAAGLTVIMSLAVSLVLFMKMSALSTLILQIVIGSVLYILLSKAFKIESLGYIVSTVVDIKNNRRRAS